MNRSILPAILCSIALLAAIYTVAVVGTAVAYAAPARCAEDDPCWTWSKMGNRKRGVVTLHGNYRVVGPCEFARLWDAGKLRYSVRVGSRTYQTLLRMRGDAYARAHGCEGSL